MKPALDATDVIQKAAVYIVEGRPYCFYFDGWHGAGWYRCGFAHRRNLGWGGEYGWQGWSYGPAEKRYGHGGTTVREGTTVRSKSTVREKTEGPSKNVGGTTTIRRSTTGAGSQGGGEIKGGAQMQKDAAPAGGGKVQGGAQGGTKAHDGGGKGRVVHKAARAAVARSSNARSIHSDLTRERPPKRPLLSKRAGRNVAIETTAGDVSVGMSPC